MKHLVAIDLSQHNTGISIWDIKKRECINLYIITTGPIKPCGDVEITRIYYNSTDNLYVKGFKLACSLISIITRYKVNVVCMEDHTYGSLYRGAQSIEFASIVKHYLYMIVSSVIMIPITSVKKFAVNNGRASKEDMIDQFNNEVGFISTSDVADAYFIGKFTLYNKGDLLK